VRGFSKGWNPQKIEVPNAGNPWYSYLSGRENLSGKSRQESLPDWSIGLPLPGLAWTSIWFCWRFP
jgi:hypothetical protein